MPRYIDADLMLSGRSDDVLYDSGGYRVFIREWLESQPTIDAVPVVRGEWIKVDQVYVKCFFCEKHYFNSAREYSFCPNCGADMRESEERE